MLLLARVCGICTATLGAWRVAAASSERGGPAASDTQLLDWRLALGSIITTRRAATAHLLVSQTLCSPGAGDGQQLRLVMHWNSTSSAWRAAATPSPGSTAAAPCGAWRQLRAFSVVNRWRTAAVAAPGTLH
ncbi:unnamed protein product [Closterium sp. NIES-65]|nr:unnamed protein product [Closterium sp. NIES-65]